MPRLLQRLPNEIAFYALDDALQRQGLRRMAGKPLLPGIRGLTLTALAVANDFLGQMGRLDLITATENHGALNDVLEFTYVARPAVGQQETLRLGRDAADVAPQRLVEVLNKARGEEQDVPR